MASDQVAPPVYASDGATANIAVPLVGKNGTVSVQGSTLTNVEKKLLASRPQRARRRALSSTAPDPAACWWRSSTPSAASTGRCCSPPAWSSSCILLVVYRSPILWFFPLFSAVLALGAAALVIYELAKNNVLTLNGQSQGILSVLVLGAGTDYALLLISRYREELHNYESRVEAMVKAWRRRGAGHRARRRPRSSSACSA